VPVWRGFRRCRHGAHRNGRPRQFVAYPAAEQPTYQTCDTGSVSRPVPVHASRNSPTAQVSSGRDRWNP
jgi:hypothetical protein